MAKAFVVPRAAALPLALLRQPRLSDMPPGAGRTASFQRWNDDQRNAGNTLMDARLVWMSRVSSGPDAHPFRASHVQVRIGTETG